MKFKQAGRRCSDRLHARHYRNRLGSGVANAAPCMRLPGVQCGGPGGPGGPGWSGGPGGPADLRRSADPAGPGAAAR